MPETIGIFGEINEETTSSFITELFDADWSKEKELDIIVSSQGGSLDFCFAIIDAINVIKQTYNVKVKTLGLGLVASSGFLIFLIGDERVLSPNCRVFVHEHMISFENVSYDKMKEVSKDNKQDFRKYIMYIAERLGITKRKAISFIKHERNLSKKEISLYNIEKSTCSN